MFIRHGEPFRSHSRSSIQLSRPAFRCRHFLGAFCGSVCFRGERATTCSPWSCIETTWLARGKGGDGIETSGPTADVNRLGFCKHIDTNLSRIVIGPDHSLGLEPFESSEN